MRLAAAVRIVTGVLFIAEGCSKVMGEFVHGGFAKAAVRMSHEAWPFWGRFLQTAVVPHAGPLGWAFALGELAVGIGLLLGFWTRVACAGGLALMASILLADARPGKGAGWTDWVTAGLTPKFAFLLLLLLLAADAGRVWGMDGSLSKRRRPAARLS